MTALSGASPLTVIHGWRHKPFVTRVHGNEEELRGGRRVYVLICQTGRKWSRKSVSTLKSRLFFRRRRRCCCWFRLTWRKVKFVVLNRSYFHFRISRNVRKVSLVRVWILQCHAVVIHVISYYKFTSSNAMFKTVEIKQVEEEMETYWLKSSINIEI